MTTHHVQVTVTDVVALLDSPAESPVLYIEEAHDGLRLSVRAAALVYHGSVVATRESVVDWLGAGDADTITEDVIADYLSDLQADVDEVADRLSLGDA